MRRQDLSRFSPLRYAIVAGALLVMFLIHMAAAAYLGTRSPVIVMVLPVIVAALFGGIGVGLVTTILAAGSSVALLIAEGPVTFADQLRVGFFLIDGILVSWLVGSRTRALNAEQAGARQLRRAIAEAPLPVILHAENGEILELSRSFLELTGYREDQLRTLHEWTHLAYGERAPEVRANLAHLYTLDRHVDEGEYRVRTSTDAERLWHFRAAPLGCDGSGRRLVVSMAVDVTEQRRAEEALREAESHLRRVLDNLVAFVGLLDRDGFVVHVNQAPVAAAAIRAEDVVGKQLWDSHWWSHSEVEQTRLKAAFRRALEGEVVRYDLMIRMADNHRMWVDFQLAPLADESGRISEVILSAMDITERKEFDRELRRAHELIAGIAEGTDDLIAAADCELRLMYANAAYRREFKQHWNGDIDVGASLEEWLAPWPEERQRSVALWRRALAGEAFSTTGEFGPPGKGRQIYDLRFNPIYDRRGEQVGAAHILRNVTEREHMQQALKRQESLLRQTDRRKDEFIAVLGHELRNPLAPLRTGVELLGSFPLPAHLVPVKAMMERQIVHLTRLVDDLLDLSRISRGTMELKRDVLELNEVLDAAIEQARPQVEQRRHTLLDQRAPIALPMIGDFQRLVQIVANVLNNAAKYMDPGGEIRLRTEAIAGAGVVRVEDRGFGIPTEHLESVFDMFSQVPEHRASTGGGDLGIGLALSRLLAALHGGSIEATSAGLGRGSEFILRLPLHLEAARKQVEPERSRVCSDAVQRVLVVDDNVDAADSMSLLLETQGFVARAVHNGPEAVAAAESFRPDVVLLDIGLPGMDGYEVARRLRDSPRGDQLLLFALTGWGQAADKRRARDAGFDEHLTKPVDMALISTLIAAGVPSRARS